ERMLMAQWKLRRLWRQERNAYAAYEKRRGAPDPDGTFAYLQDCSGEQAFTRLSRQESQLHRIYHQCESRLRILQELRRQGLRKAEAEDAEFRETLLKPETSQSLPEVPTSALAEAQPAAVIRAPEPATEAEAPAVELPIDALMDS